VTDIPRVDWYGCFDKTWAGLLVGEAFSHPAKAPHGLAERIYRHMLDNGWIKPGDKIIDPFGGIGGLGFHAALFGLHWTGCELEARFVDLGNGYECSEAHPCPACKPAFDELARCRRAEEEAKALLDGGTEDDTEAVARQAAYDHAHEKLLDALTVEPCGQRQAGNIETWRARYAPHFPGYGSARLLQGDSRRLRAVIAEADGVVSSPPFHDSLDLGLVNAAERRQVARAAGISNAEHISPIDMERHKLRNQADYDSTPGQLGAMPAGSHDAVVSSPPYAQARIDGHGDEGASGLRAQDGSYLRGPDGWQQRKAMGGRYGDSDGNLANLPAGELADGVVSSPPYAETEITGRRNFASPANPGGQDANINTADRQDGYGSTPGNLGALRAGDWDAAISSPPYAETINQTDGANDAQARVQRKAAAGVDVTQPINVGGPNSVLNQPQNYGSTPGNLGALRAGDWDATISSPPYADGAQHTGGETRMTSGQGGPIQFVAYGSSPGQLADLPAGDFDASVASPPYEQRTVHGQAGVTREGFADPARVGKTSAALVLDDYGADPDNLGNNTGETFWSAARTILEETFAILKPGGYAAWITGDFVRDKKRVLFGEQWLALCEAVGFEPVLWAVAWKAETHGHQLGIFGEPVELRTSKVSFFRRLANRNNPDAAIENEDVLFVRKPL